eukprot:11565-Heterococcus_DN1.PRE.2
MNEVHARNNSELRLLSTTVSSLYCVLYRLSANSALACGTESSQYCVVHHHAPKCMMAVLYCAA